MHPFLHFIPIFYALGVVTWLSYCCPGASGNYAWPGVGAECACPAAQFIWAQQRVQGTLCGYPELTPPSSPPNYYETLTWSGTMTQVVNYPTNNLSGTTGGSSETIYGVTIPANSSYTLAINQFEQYVNIYSGSDDFSSPEIALAPSGAPCAEADGATVAYVSTLTTVTTGSYTPLAGGDAVPVSNTTVAPFGIGSGSTSPTGGVNIWGSLIEINYLPPGEPAFVGNESYGGISGEIVSATVQVFTGGSTITGTLTQTLSGEQDEAAIIAGQTPATVTFTGGVMGGSGGWNSLAGSSDYPSSVGGGGPGGGIDWCGPMWADRTDRQVDQAAAQFAILVTNLVAGMPMKCTVQAYRAAYAVATGDPLTPSFGTPETVGDPMVFTFTPTEDWYLIGATAPGGFDPTSFDPTTLTPTETVISGAAPQGWIYGALIVAVEPQ